MGFPQRSCGQGSLTPPGPPAPTMKTLDQVEARTDVATLAGDGTGVHVIKAIGSYYLTRDLVGASGKDTIRVATAGRVTIDLNGFALISTATDRAAIALPSANDAIVIRNGIILAGGSGTATRAVGGGASRVVCEDLAIVGNAGGDLLELGDDCVVRRCRLSEGGITAGNRSVVTDCTVNGTSDSNITLGQDSAITNVRFTLGRGELRVADRGQISDCEVNAVGAPTLLLLSGNVVQTGSGGVVRRCTVSAGNVAGNAIGVGSGSLVEGCRVLSAFREGITSNTSGNVTVTDCSVQGNGRDGIRLGSNARVRDCVVQGSAVNGVSVGENSVVSGCAISGAGTAGFGAGIVSAAENVSVSRSVVKAFGGTAGISLVSGSVTDCEVSGTVNGPGIQVTQTCRVERNRSTSNGTTSPANPQSGLKVVGANNRLEGNQLVNNAGIGLEIASSGAINTNTGNLVIGNSARNNSGGNFSISSGNAVGPIVTSATIGGSTDIHPSANYTP